jgi:hypothetical protein
VPHAYATNDASDIELAKRSGIEANRRGCLQRTCHGRGRKRLGRLRRCRLLSKAENSAHCEAGEKTKEEL